LKGGGVMDLIYWISLGQSFFIFFILWDERRTFDRLKKETLAYRDMAVYLLDQRDKLLAEKNEYPSPFQKPFTNPRSGMGVKDNVQG
jgi:hypothetical protein